MIRCTVFWLSATNGNRSSNRLALGEERIEAEVEISEGHRLCVGMPRKLFFALREGDEAAVCAEAFKKREANTEFSCGGLSGGRRDIRAIYGIEAEERSVLKSLKIPIDFMGKFVL